MLLYTIALITIGAAIWCLLSGNNPYNRSGLAMAIMFFGGIGIFLSFFIMIISYAFVPKNLLEFRNLEESIYAQIESKYALKELDDDSILQWTKDEKIISDIRYYNERVIERQNNIDNIWLGIYVPNAYKDLKLIDYKVIFEMEKQLR